MWAHLRRFPSEVGFNLAHSGPKLDRLQCDVLITVFHAHDSKLWMPLVKPIIDMKVLPYPEQSALHVVAHLIVVQGHNLHHTLKCANLNGCVGILSSFANNLHNVVALPLNSLVSLGDLYML